MRKNEGPTALVAPVDRCDDRLMTESTSLPTDRMGLEVLPPEKCWSLLGGAPIGRIAFVDAGEPVILPVTFVLDGHSIVFRSLPGTKLDAAGDERRVAFEIDAWSANERRGWSVLVRGAADAVVDADEIARLASLGLDPWLDAAADARWVRVRADEITGRRLA